MKAGIDILDNGEQPRESFFLYVRDRVSGFSGHSSRRPSHEVTRYPVFADLQAQRESSKTDVISFKPPKVTGPVVYLDRAANKNDCAVFRAILDDLSADVGEAFMSAPSPGIIADAVPNEHHDTDGACVDALADALSVWPEKSCVISGRCDSLVCVQAKERRQYVD